MNMVLKNRVLEPTLTLLLILLICTKIICQQTLIDTGKACIEDTLINHENGKQICIHNVGCPYYYPIILKTIRCENVSLLSLKSYKEIDYDYLQLYPLTLNVSNSRIPVLPTSIFKNMVNVTTLILENIKLKAIMRGAFNNLDRLKEIYLGQNKLTIISEGIFNDLLLLEKLDLSKNEIETIADHAFAGTSLKDLNLSHNHILSLERVLLHPSYISLDVSHNNLTNITIFYNLAVNYLNLSHNSIETMDFEFFREVSMSIDISFNNISHIRNFNAFNASRVIVNHNKISEFEKNDNLTVFDISYNNFQHLSSNLLSINLVEFYASHNFISSISVDAFFGIQELTYLYLDNNNLTSIPKLCFKNLTNLLQLSVSYNVIASIDSYAFFGLRNLTDLYLDHNNLTSIPNSCFKDLTSLTYLNLSSNNIAYCKFGTFDSLLKLQVLDISNNNFKELPQHTLHSLGELTVLSFRGNEISDINTDDLVAYLKQLKVIDLRNNPWYCHKLAKITHTLKGLNISFSVGNSWDENNIHGIRCYEMLNTTDLSNINAKPEITDNSILKSTSQNYFNEDFKTKIFKYLEDLKKSINSNNIQNSNITKILTELKPKDLYELKKSELYINLINDFKNSSFIKHFEILRDATLNASKLKTIEDNKLEDIANSFKNISKELENMLQTDIKHSENPNATAPRYFEDIADSRREKLINQYDKAIEYPNYTGLLSVIVILLLLILCIMATIAYRSIFHISKYSLSAKEEVELM